MIVVFAIGTSRICRKIAAKETLEPTMCKKETLTIP
jgi:hypothetical protein